jgi:hypothetical protein
MAVLLHPEYSLNWKTSGKSLKAILQRTIPEGPKPLDRRATLTPPVVEGSKTSLALLAMLIIGRNTRVADGQSINCQVNFVVRRLTQSL